MALFKFKTKKEEVGESIKILKPDNQVEIVSISGERELITYTKLVQVVSEKEVIIMPPRNKNGAMIRLDVKLEYKIRFKLKNGMLENTIKEISYIMESGAPALRVILLGPTIKIQRRASFRLNVELKFKYSVIEKDKKQQSKIFDAKTVDISSGGLKFLCNEEIEPNTLIKIVLDIGDELFIVTLAKIIFGQPVYDNRDYKISYSCKFENMQQNYQENLSKYIFDMQKKLSKKGAL